MEKINISNYSHLVNENIDEDKIPFNEATLIEIEPNNNNIDNKCSEKIKSFVSNFKEILFNKKAQYIIVYFLYFISIIFYLISLIGCKDSYSKCQTAEYINLYFLLAKCIIISSLIFIVDLFLHFLMKLNKYNYFIFFLIYFVIFYASRGTNFANHGTYNLIGFIIFFIFGFIILFFLYKFFFYCYNRERKKWLAILLIIIILIIIWNILTPCSNFYNGMGGEKIINDPLSDACELQIPSSCGLDFLTGLSLLDFSFLRRTCEGINNDKEKFFKYLDKKNNEYNNFSFPRTEHYPPKNSFTKLVDYVEKDIKEVKNNEEMEHSNREVFVSFDKEGMGKIEIYLKKNNTLIEERRKIAEKNPVKFENIYILYIDAISRNHFRRKMKKTTKIIEKMLYINRNKVQNNSIYDNYNSFQFFKYYNFDANTIGNNLPFIYGSSHKATSGISMTKFMKEKGFITCMTHNSCNKELFEWNEEAFKEFEFAEWDHENLALFCDSNYEDKNNIWAIVDGKSSVVRKCFYGKDSFEYNFEYVSQFLEAYKNERKFFKLMIGDGHESTLEVVKYIDNTLSKFLENILNNYSDDKTIIIVMSDHGAQMPGLYDIILYKERIMEKFLGCFFLILPKKNNNNITNYDNIFYNQQKFITTYDLHDTLLDAINVDKLKYPKMDNEKGQSLFEKINGKKRDCSKFPGEIETCFCESYANK